MGSRELIKLANCQSPKMNQNSVYVFHKLERTTVKVWVRLLIYLNWHIITILSRFFFLRWNNSIFIQHFTTFNSDWEEGDMQKNGIWWLVNTFHNEKVIHLFRKWTHTISWTDRMYFILRKCTDLSLEDNSIIFDIENCSEK